MGKKKDYFHIYCCIEFCFICFRLNSPICSETFKKFLEPILKDYEQDDDSSLVTDISPSTS
jgi:hypothetical protein